MSTTGTSEAAAKFIKTYTHDEFIKPSMKIYHSSETDSTYCNTKFYDVHLSDKVLPFLGDLQFEPLKTSSHKSSTGSLNNPESISEGEERDWNDSSYEETDEVDNGDKVPELVRPRQVYKRELSRSPRKNIMLHVDEHAQAYLQGRGSLRRASAPVVVITDLKERNEPTPLAAVSKDEGDVPETPAHVIELLKQEAAIRSQVNLRRMKHLDYRRGSCIPKVHSSPNLTAKPISSARVHKVMQTFFGPQTKKQQRNEMKQVGVLDPATKSSKIKIQSAPKVAGMAGSPPRQPVIPVAPLPPEIMPSALLGNEKGTSDMPEVKPAPVVLEKPKLTEVVLTEVVATLNPTISLSTADQFSEVAMRRSSVLKDLEDTFKKMDRGSAEFSDSGSFTQSGESGSGSSWFGGLIGLRPVPAPRKPGETKPAPVKKKVKKRDLNAFAPAGF